MKKKSLVYIICGLLIFLLASCTLFNFNKKHNKKITKVTVAEVAHTIFYAPQYVAISKGFFEENYAINNKYYLLFPL